MRKKHFILACLLAGMAFASAEAQIDDQDFTRQQQTQQQQSEQVRQAQQQAEQAQQAAQQAAAKAAAERRKAAGDRQPMMSEEALRIAEQQERQQQEARAKRERKMNRKGESDSVRWAANQLKLHTWKNRWFAGGNVGANLAVADNITDHPPFRYFGDAMGLGVEAYAGKFISRTVALRVGLGYHNVKNRLDKETVDEAWRPTSVVRPVLDGQGQPVVDAEGVPLTRRVAVYPGNGFIRFGLMEAYADVLFNVSAISVANRFKPFHVYVMVGLGMVATGEKKLKEPGLLGEFERTEKGMLVIPDAVRADDAPGRGPRTYEGAASPESRFSKKSHVGISGRLGLMFDYRFSRSMSANMELTTTVTDDRMEGIKFDEPFDILVKLSAGVKWHF